MKKNIKLIIGIVSAVIVVAAAVAAIIIFREEIMSALSNAKEKLTGCASKRCSCRNRYTPEECEDFADL